MPMTPISEMDTDDVRAEIESLEDYMRECAAIGQGVNTKESVRHRLLRAELESREG